MSERKSIRDINRDLRIACIAGNYEIIESLISNGADIHTRNNIMVILL